MFVIVIALLAQFWYTETKAEVIFADTVKQHNAITGILYILPCSAPDNSFSLDWLHNGENIVPTEIVEINTNGLLIKSITNSDVGLYTCRLTNSDTEQVAERMFQLEVLSEPQIINTESVYEVTAGQPFEIQCSSFGNPRPVYQWIREKNDLSLDSRFSVNVGTMRIIQVEENDQGIYSCVANNSVGASEKKFTINVNTKPHIYELENVTIVLNNEGILTCKAKGRPAPSITFSRFGSKFEVGQWQIFPDIIPNHVFNEELGESIGTLNISSAKKWDGGEYDCSAKNKVDSVTQTTYVTIEYPPNFDFMEKPSPLYTWGGRSVNVTCIADSLPKAKVLWYWNEALNIDNISVIEEETRFGVSKSTLIVTPVDDRYYGTYKCVADNKHGQVERIIEIREANPPEPITEVRVRGWSTKSISFEITSSKTGTPAESYKYQYKEESEPDWNNSKTMTYTPISKEIPMVTVLELKPKTVYNFRFSAENQLGSSQYGDIITQETMCEHNFGPIKVLNKYAEDISKDELPFIESPYSDKIELIWEPLIDDCGEKVYTLRYCLGTPFDSERITLMYGGCKDVDGITTTKYVMNNLTAGSYYHVRLFTRFVATTEVNVRTARDDGDKRLKIFPTHSLQSVALGMPFNLTCKPKVENRELLSNLSWRDPWYNIINTTSPGSDIYTESTNDGDLSLVLPYVKGKLKGYYYCTASYGAEDIETYVNIDTYISSNYVFGIAGSDTYISCNIDDASNVEWLYEDTLIEPSDHYEFKIYEGYNFRQPNLWIRNLTEADEGFYMCRNTKNSTLNFNQMKLRLEIQFRPEIVTFETQYLATEGDDVLINCSAIGKPAPNLHWETQNFTDVSIIKRFSVNRFGRMKVTSVEEKDSGNYTCIASSSAGISRKTIELNVIKKTRDD